MGLFGRTIKIDERHFAELIGATDAVRSEYQRLSSDIEHLQRKVASIQGQIVRAKGIYKQGDTDADESDPEARKFLESTYEWQQMQKALNRGDTSQ